MTQQGTLKKTERARTRLTVRVPPQTLLQRRRQYSARAAKRSFPAVGTTHYLNILTNAVTKMLFMDVQVIFGGLAAALASLLFYEMPSSSYSFHRKEEVPKQLQVHRRSLLRSFHFRVECSSMVWNTTGRRTAWQNGELVRMLAIRKTYWCDCLASVLPHRKMALPTKHFVCLSVPPHRKTVRRKKRLHVGLCVERYGV